MTLKEEACSLINQLPDKVMEDVVWKLKRIFDNPNTWKSPEQEVSEKMKALWELQALRSDARKLGSMDYATAREEAMYEKYGI